MTKMLTFLYKTGVFTLFILLFPVLRCYGQKDISLDGFWQSRIEYQCSWGWKDESGSVLLSKQFGNSYKGMIFGGDVEITHWYGDEYDMEILGQNGCIRKGKMKMSEFAGRIYLRGEWKFSGGNDAMWGTGLCCHGNLELYRDVPKEKQIATTREQAKKDTTALHSHAKLEAGKKFILKNVLFKLSSDELLPEAYAEIDKLATILKENPNMVIRLEGHTDIDGPRRMNKKLSKKRVEQVKHHLVNRGIAKERVKLKWYGEKKPLLKKGSVEQRKINRRVEVHILKT